MKILIAGPWIGEFGWEICKWIPYLRYKVWEGDYDKVIIVCRTGHGYLYCDFATNFLTHDPVGQTTEWLLDNKEPKLTQEIYELAMSRPPLYHADSIRHYITNREPGTELKRDTIEPTKVIRETDKLFYLMYGETCQDGYDILIHARSTEKYNTGYRNLDVNKWQDIISKYNKYKLASIGSHQESMHIPGTEDLRGLLLGSLTQIMKAAKLLIGPSSGPAHLASMCGLSHVVWSDSRIHGVIGRNTNKERYKTLWNPFNTPVYGIWNTWQPSAKDICNQIDMMLKRKIVIPQVPIRRKEIRAAEKPFIAMTTFNRPELFSNTIRSLEASKVNVDNLFIFDDNSTDPYKNSYLKTLKGKYYIVQHSQQLGIFVNAKMAIDMVCSMSNDNYIIYCQDDIEFSVNWYNNAIKIMDKVNRDGVDWGIIALLHYTGGTKEPYYTMKRSHPGGACWIVNKKMWQEYRKDNIIYDMENIGDRLIDFKLSHWCHHNGRKWAVIYTGKSLIKHVGAKSTMSDKDLSKYTGLGYDS